MKNISIFARRHFFGDDKSVPTKLFLHRSSSLIRGEQIAQYLKARCNLLRVFEDDVCIYLKPKTLDNIKDGAYVDISDGSQLVELLQKRPKIRVIASYNASFKYLKSVLKNEVFLVPEHHCNFDRTVRTRTQVTTAGIITNPSATSFLVNKEVERRLKEIGFEFIAYYYYQTRMDVVNF